MCMHSWSSCAEDRRGGGIVAARWRLFLFYGFSRMHECDRWTDPATETYATIAISNAGRTLSTLSDAMSNISTSRSTITLSVREVIYS